MHRFETFAFENYHDGSL